MIRQEELVKIGVFNKPHGVKGELLFTFTDDIFDRCDCDYLVCPIDGIFTPFFINEYRFKSDTTALVLIDGVNSVEKARMFTNVDVYFPRSFYDEAEELDDVPISYLIGFTACDVHEGELGHITDIDDSTANVLAAIERTDGEQCLVPLREELIKDIDHHQKTITFDLPEGLLTMNHEERE
jgi:16S rRNA processing protein RimM